MKNMKIHLIETSLPNGADRTKTYVDIGTNYLQGFGIPVAHVILSVEDVDVNVFEPGDRVSCEVLRGSQHDIDNNVSWGGFWTKKTGTIISAHGEQNTMGFIEFDDGDIQSMSLIQGDKGYPGRNAQAVL